MYNLSFLTQLTYPIQSNLLTSTESDNGGARNEFSNPVFTDSLTDGEKGQKPPEKEGEEAGEGEGEETAWAKFRTFLGEVSILGCRYLSDPAIGRIRQ